MSNVTRYTLAISAAVWTKLTGLRFVDANALMVSIVPTGSGSKVIKTPTGNLQIENAELLVLYACGEYAQDSLATSVWTFTAPSSNKHFQE